MVDAPLIRPDGRLVGGLTRDFSLFGGQTDPDLKVGAVPADGTAIPNPTQAPGVPRDGTDPAPPPAHATSEGPAATTLAPPAASPAPVPHPVTAQAANTHSDAPVTAQPTGATTLPEVLTALAPHASAAEGPGAPAAPTANTDAETLVAQQLDEGAIPLLGSLTGASLALAGLALDPAAQAHAAAQDIGQAASHLVTATTDQVAPLADLLVADAATTVAGPVEAATDLAGEAAAAPVSMTTGVAAGLATDVATAAAAAPAEAAAAVTTAIPTVAATVHDLTDTTPLGGSDPAGGITTLVGMVNTADHFAVSASTQAPAPEPSGSIVDDLIGPATGSALLGDTDHHTDIAHVTHDAVDHVGGLL